MSSPFNSNSVNATSPLVNWNFTERAKDTPETVFTLRPTLNGSAGPKNQLPLAVVFATRKFAPPSGNEVTLIDNVCA